MKISIQEGRAEQARRLPAKTQDWRMIKEIVSGTGMSPREVQDVVECVVEFVITPAPVQEWQICPESLLLQRLLLLRWSFVGLESGIGGGEGWRGFRSPAARYQIQAQHLRAMASASVSHR